MSYYLGIDASSSKIGICVLDDKKNLCYNSVVKLNSKHSLEQRGGVFEKEIKIIKQTYSIDKIFLEEPFLATFGGKGTAKTTGILNTFSGIIRYIVFKIFDKETILIDVRVARKELNIKIDKGVKGKFLKKVIISYVRKLYDSFEYKETKQGNYSPGTDDRADAIIICLVGIRFYNK